MANGPPIQDPAGRELGLPAPQVPFPVEAPFRMRPDLKKADLAEPPVAFDALAPRYLAEKFAAMQAAASCLAVDAAARDGWAGTLERLLRWLACAAPDWFVAEPDGWRLMLPGLRLRRADWSVTPASGAPTPGRAPAPRAMCDWLAAQPPAERVAHAIGLGMQDDWVLMQHDLDAAGSGTVRARWLHVCFPSGWLPADKVGCDLASIHAPVADGAPLRAASAGLARAMTDKGPFVRHVWTLAASGALAQPPGQACRPAEALDAIWFRVERQLTAPLGQGWSLFLIRVHVAPLARLAGDAARRAALVGALASMSEPVVRYKRIGPLREQVLAAWSAGEPE